MVGGKVTFRYDLASQRRIVQVLEPSPKQLSLKHHNALSSSSSSKQVHEHQDAYLVGFGSKSEMRKRLADAVDAEKYLSLDGLGRYKYVMELSRKLVEEEETRRRVALENRLKTPTRGSFNLVDLTLL